MKTTICFALAMIAAATAIPANYGPPSAALVVGPAKPYSYAYEVVDPVQSGNAFGHRETSDGNGAISGEYRVVLPDTRTQIVRYSVSAATGYVAEVTYEGTPVFPAAKIKRSHKKAKQSH